MKRGFTLIELLVVITIMATLMTIMFRLGNVSDSKTALITTESRLQRLENCLAGYYSAFGSYPPVAIYGSRNIFAELDERGIGGGEGENDELRWDQIEAACRSQPLSAAFPFPNDGGVAGGFQESLREAAVTAQDQAHKKNCNWQDDAIAKWGEGFTGDPYGLLNGEEHWDKKAWQQVQIFKFGLMSYLLPRYLMMMNGRKEYYGYNGSPCRQWSDSNDHCIDPVTGDTLEWDEMLASVEVDEKGEPLQKANYIRVQNMPTQAVCGRWISNLSGICNTCTPNKLAHYDKVFGVNIKVADQDPFNCDKDNPPTLELYSPKPEGGSWYALNSITVWDGWKHEFYYYSPNGAQSYVLWSAGENGLTFPPWVDKKGYLDQKPIPDKGDVDTVAEAIEDDIVRMNH